MAFLESNFLPVGGSSRGFYNINKIVLILNTKESAYIYLLKGILSIVC